MLRELVQWAAETAGLARNAAVELPSVPDREAKRLEEFARRRAPRRSGALARSLRSRGPEVVSDRPYAVLQDQGGRVVARVHGYLTVPVRPGYRPGPGFVTVWRSGEGFVFRGGRHVLWALRRREVRIRGSQYLQRALQDHLAGVPQRVDSVVRRVFGG